MTQAMAVGAGDAGFTALEQTKSMAKSANVAGAQEAAKSSTAAPVAGTTKDTAAVSGTGSALADALVTSDVRMQKVDEIRSAISDGSYNVSSSAVADKLIEDMTK